MPSIEILITFFITTAIFAYIPGPPMLYAAAQTLARGRKDEGDGLAWHSSWGVCACGCRSSQIIYFVSCCANALYGDETCRGTLSHLACHFVVSDQIP